MPPALALGALTTAAMVAFAANSILARLALATGSIDDLGYSGWRLASGALTLVLVLRLMEPQRPLTPLAGSWPQAVALFGYAVFFSIAYLWLGAAVGAIVLFGAVQAGMIGRALIAGDRPGALEILGLTLAFGALVWLVSPGVAAPPLMGVVVMALSGFCWAAYSLLGRGSTAPVADTAGNFVRCLPVALGLVAWSHATGTPSAFGIACAIASGAIASGLGYAVWYRVLPRLSRVTAASVQLSVPAIAATGAVVLLAEPLTLRLVLASAAIIAGMALTVVAGERRRRG